MLTHNNKENAVNDNRVEEAHQKKIMHSIMISLFFKPMPP